MIQDILPHKLDNQYRPREIREDDTVLIFLNKQILIKGELGQVLTLPLYREVKADFKAEEMIYLFSMDDKGYFMPEQVPADYELEGYSYILTARFRQIYANPCNEVCLAAMTGWHLYTWYQANLCCGHCGAKTVHHPKIRCKVCPECKNMFFPKISPAVIMGVYSGDKILMSKYSGRDYNGFALLAGFIEIGETAEECVVREAKEEVDLEVGNVRYYKSQPWGLDGNLSIGYFAELTGEDKIKIDEEELSMARWYKREDIPVEDDEYTLTYDMINFFRNNPDWFK